MRGPDQETCFFLHGFPPELRLMVYENVLLTSSSLTAPRLDERHGVDLALLRVNRQVHDEAAAVLYGQNTFSIRPRVNRQVNDDAREPAIGPRYRHLVRALTIEVLCCPQATPPPAETHHGASDAAEYISSLTNLLSHTTTLHSLTLTLSPPDTLPSKHILAALLPLQTALPGALARLPLAAPMRLAFEFGDCYYRTRVDPEFLAGNSLLLVACKVLFWKSHLRVEKMVREEEGEALRGGDRKTDLGGLVGEGVERVVERGREVLGVLERVGA